MAFKSFGVALRSFHPYSQKAFFVGEREAADWTEQNELAIETEALVFRIEHQGSLSLDLEF